MHFRRCVGGPVGGYVLDVIRKPRTPKLFLECYCLASIKVVSHTQQFFVLSRLRIRLIRCEKTANTNGNWFSFCCSWNFVWILMRCSHVVVVEKYYRLLHAICNAFYLLQPAALPHWIIKNVALMRTSFKSEICCLTLSPLIRLPFSHLCNFLNYCAS